MNQIPHESARFKDWADKACCIEGAIWPDELTKLAYHAWDGLRKGDDKLWLDFGVAFAEWQAKPVAEPEATP